MSKINTKNILLQDKTYLQANIYLGYPLQSNRADIQFINQSNSLEIISSSAGSIINNHLTIKKPNSFIQTVLEYIKEAEVLVSFFLDDNLISSESIKINSQEIEEKPVTFQTSKANSFWKTFLYKDEDEDGILLRIMRAKENCYLCIGEKSEQINSNDIIFKMYTGIKKMVISKSDVEKFLGKDIACFEIVKKHNTSNNNIYQKILTSNILTLDDE